MIRFAKVTDAEEMHRIRLSVKENVLSNPSLVPLSSYLPFLSGSAFVCEEESQIRGFSAVDLTTGGVWALFVDPIFERQGIGKQLLDALCAQFFEGPCDMMWLTTDPDTRAEKFYRSAGWSPVGYCSNGEVRFELRRGTWTKAQEDLPRMGW